MSAVPVGGSPPGSPSTSVDVFEVAAALVERVRVDFPEDVDLVAYYGSYARGTATERSDLDVFFVPATERGREARLTFLVGGLSVDFWAIDWTWLERSARLAERGAPIVAESRILYARSDDVRERFAELRRLLQTQPAEGDLDHYADLAAEKLRDAYVPLHRLQSRPATTLADARRVAVQVVQAVCAALALLNRTYLRRPGVTGQLEEVLELPWRPAGLAQDLRTALYADDVEAVDRACAQLVDGVSELISAHRPPRLPASAVGFFEELSGTCDKLRTACAAGDYPTALFAAASIEQEISSVLGRSERPDLVSRARPGDLAGLSIAVDEAQATLKQRLAAEGVPLREFDSVAALATFLSGPSQPID